MRGTVRRTQPKAEVAWFMSPASCAILVAILLMWSWCAVAQSGPGRGTARHAAVILTNQPSLTNGRSPAIKVSARTLDFGSVPVGSSKKLSFTVENVGARIVKGTVAVSPPFSILGGSPRVLARAQSQVITVEYAPTAIGMHMTAVRFAGADGATVTVTGSATQPLPPAPARRPSPPLERPVLRLIARL